MNAKWFFNELKNIVSNYNGTVNTKIQIKPKNVMPDSYIKYTSSVKATFEIGNIASISKSSFCKTLFL